MYNTCALFCAKVLQHTNVFDSHYIRHMYNTSALFCAIVLQQNNVLHKCDLLIIVFQCIREVCNACLSLHYIVLQHKNVVQ